MATANKNKYSKGTHISERKFRQLIKCFLLDLNTYETSNITNIIPSPFIITTLITINFSSMKKSNSRYTDWTFSHIISSYNKLSNIISN